MKVGDLVRVTRSSYALCKGDVGIVVKTGRVTDDLLGQSVGVIFNSNAKVPPPSTSPVKTVRISFLETIA